jgi:hypothetical protein
VRLPWWSCLRISGRWKKSTDTTVYKMNSTVDCRPTRWLMMTIFTVVGRCRCSFVWWWQVWFRDERERQGKNSLSLQCTCLLRFLFYLLSCSLWFCRTTVVRVYSVNDGVFYCVDDRGGLSSHSNRLIENSNLTNHKPAIINTRFCGKGELGRDWNKGEKFTPQLSLLLPFIFFAKSSCKNNLK